MTDNNIIDLKKIPVSALRTPTKNAIASLLNPYKIFVTDEGLPRDWRGLAQLLRVPAEIMPSLSASSDPSTTIISLLNQDNIEKANLKMLLENFERLDRYDIVDDLNFYFESDARDYINHIPVENANTSISPQVQSFVSDDNIITQDDVNLSHQGTFQTYDAFVLHADEEEDFALTLVERMENFGLRLCMKNRDMVVGLSNQYLAMQRLIAERCAKLIVIVSPLFLNSPANKFLVSFAQALGIDQGQRKIIPCVYKSCDLPPQLLYYSKLSFVRPEMYFNVWEKLRVSIKPPAPVPIASQRLRIRELPTPAIQINGYREPQILTPTDSMQSHRSISSTYSEQLSPSSIYKPAIRISPADPQMLNTTTLSLPGYFPPISQSVSETNLVNEHLLDVNIHSVRSNSETFTIPDSMVNGSLPSFDKPPLKNKSIKKKKWYDRFLKFNGSSKKRMPVVAD